MSLQELQEQQKYFDEEYYDHYDSLLQDVRHVDLHLGKLLGKISSYVEPGEHGALPSDRIIKEEVIPDLLFWALHLANTYELNLEQSYQARLAQNKQRIDNARDHKS